MKDRGKGKRLAANAAKATSQMKKLTKLDPTRTLTIRRAFLAKVNLAFAQLKGRIVKEFTSGMFSDNFLDRAVVHPLPTSNELPTSNDFNPEEHPRDEKGRFLGVSGGFSSTHQADRWASKGVKVEGGVTKGEKAALARYQSTDGHFARINATLRRSGIHDGKDAQNVKELDSLISKSTTTEHCVVQRGVKSLDLSNSLKAGVEFTDHGFCSTTLDGHTARNFTGGEGREVAVMCHINLPKGTKGAYVDGKGESELVLQRGSKFKVDKVWRDENGIKHVTMSLVDQPKPSDVREEKAKASKGWFSKLLGNKEQGKFIWDEGDVELHEVTDNSNPNHDELGRFSETSLPKVGVEVKVGGDKYWTEPFDGDDTFPPMIASYEIKDRHIFYTGRNGSEGVVTGTKEDSQKWMKEVDKAVKNDPPDSHKLEEWNPSHGGKENVEAAIDAVAKTASKFGITQPEVKVFVSASSGIEGESSNSKISLVNTHKSSKESSLNFKVEVSREVAIASHETVHSVYQSNSDIGKKYQDELASSGETVSAYHALGGHNEGLMVFVVAYVHSPNALRKYSPKLYDIADRWSKEMKSLTFHTSTTKNVELSTFRQLEKHDCGVAAFKSAIDALGIEVPFLSQRLKVTKEEGTEPEAMVRVAKDIGLSAFILENLSIGDLRRHLDSGSPVICLVTMWGGGHYVTASSVREGRVYFMDPSTGKRSMPVKRFLRVWHDEETTKLGVVLGKVSPTDTDPLPSKFSWKEGEVQLHNATENMNPNHDELGRFASNPAFSTTPEGYTASYGETARLHIKMATSEDGSRVFVEGVQKPSETNWLNPEPRLAVESTFDLSKSDKSVYFNRTDALVKGKGYAKEANEHVMKELAAQGYEKMSAYVQYTDQDSQSMMKKLGGESGKETDHGKYWHFDLTRLTTNREYSSLTSNEPPNWAPSSSQEKLSGFQEYPVENTTYSWDEALHPRGADGRFLGVTIELGFLDEDQTVLLKSTERMFGKGATYQDIAKCVGASPGSVVHIDSMEHKGSGSIQAQVYGPKQADGKSTYEATRLFTFDKNGKKICINDQFHVDPDLRSKGLGTEILHSQTIELAARGFDRIETMASSDYGWNGGYTWARLGYDGKAPANPMGAAKISDLMKTEEGREWWKKNHTSFLGKFSLKEGSTSRKVLDEYVKRRRATSNSDRRRGGYSGLDMGRTVIVNSPSTEATPFSFASSPEKLQSFQEWLKTQVNSLLVGQSQEALWRVYIEQGWRKGVGRTFDDVNRATPQWTPQQQDFYAGSRDQFLRSSFNQPVAKEKVELLAARTFDEMENVTDDMSNKMSRALADGLVEGNSPHEVAKALIEVVDFSRQRAEVVARTELIRSHNEGQLTAMEQLGVEDVGVEVEWLATADEKTCPICADLEGAVFSIKDAHGMLPRHPNCRCAWVPNVEKT